MEVFGQIFVFFLFATLISPGTKAEDYSASSYFQDKLETTSDLITQDLFEKYSDFNPEDFWGPHSFTFSTTSREVIHVKGVEKRYTKEKYFQLKYARLGFNHYIIGITLNSIVVFGANFRKITSIDSPEQLVSLTVFTKWNFEEGSAEVVIPVGTRKGIQIYKLENDIIKKVNDGWPLQFDIKALEYCHVGLSTKLVVIPAQPNYPINIYNVAINKTGQVWYDQRLPISGKSHVAVYELGSESYIAISSYYSIIVYAFDNEKGRYVPDQTISLEHPSAQLLAFSIAYKHYLASVPERSGAYVEFFGYNGDHYSKEDKIANIQTLQLQAVNVEHYRDERILLSKQQGGRFEMWIYDGAKFYKSSICIDNDSCRSESDFDKAVGYTIGDISYFILPESSTSEAEVFVIEKSTEESLSPLYAQSANIFSELRALIQRYKRWESIITTAKSTLEDSLSLTGGNRITGNWNLLNVGSYNLIIKNDKTTAKKYDDSNDIEYPFGDLSFLGIKWTEQDFLIKSNDMNSRIVSLQQKITEIKALLNDAIPILSDEVHIVSAKQRVEGSFTASVLQVEKLETPAINHEDNIRKFLASFILKEKSIDIKTSVHFSGYLSVKNLFTSTLNGILVKDIARLNKVNEFKCSVELSDEVIVNGNVKTKLINGIDFSEEIIRASDISDVIFIDGLVSRKGATISTPVDGVTIQKAIFDRILLCSIPQKISIPYSFTEILTEGSFKVTLINGLKFTDFVSSIITDNYAGIIRGHKTVMGPISCDSLFIDGILNSYKFPEDLVTTSQKRLVISGHKKFTNLKAGKVAVDGKIDSISTNDVVSRMEQETLKCNWTFEERVVFLDDVTVKGYVGGVKMETLKHTDTLDQYKSSYYPDADIEFLQELQLKNFRVDETINQKGYEEIFNGLLPFDGREVKVKGETTFQKSISALDIQLNSGMVNHVKLDQIFTLDTAQDISGHKVFEKETRFASLYVLNTIDGVKLSELLENAFRLSKSRSISSHLSFEEISCSKIKVDGPVNSFQSFATAVAVAAGRSEQTFKADVKLLNFEADTIKITENLEIGDRKIDELDFNNWSRKRISLSKDFRTSVPFEIYGNAWIRGSVNADKINGIALSYLDSSVLRSDKTDQTFRSTFETSGPMRIENGEIVFKELNGFDLEQVQEDAISLTHDKEDLVTGDWTFESLVVTSELNVNGKTCGIDLAKLEVDSVREGETDIYIAGQTTFLSSVIVNQALVADSINHENILSNVFNLKDDQVISVPFYFKRNVIVEGKLITESINNVFLKWLDTVYSFTNGTTHVLKSDIEAEGSMESISLNVHNLVQGKYVKEFLQSVVSLDEDGKITGHKTFTQPIIIEGDIEAKILNEIEVRKLKSIILKSENIRFTAPVTFTNDAEGLALRITNGDLNTEGRVGGLNLKELVTEGAYLNSESSLGYLRFDNVVVTGNIVVKVLNGVTLDKVVRLDKAQHLGKFNVKKAIFNGRNVVVSGLISGSDILREYENTIFKHSKNVQVVTGLKEFRGNVYVKRNLECLGELQNQLVRLDGNRRIASTVFTKTVIVEGSFEVDGHINGFSLLQLVTDCLTNGRTETITGKWIFNKGLEFGDIVTGDGDVSGYDIDELIDEKKTEALTAEKDFEAEKLYFQKQCQMLDILFQRISRSHIRLEFFDTHQFTIVLKKPIKNLIYIRAGNVSRILTASETCEVGVFEWDSAIEEFKAGFSSPRLGEITEWESVTHGNLGILVYRSERSTCSSSQGIFVVTMDSNGVFSNKETLVRGNSAGLQLVQHKKSGSTFLFLVGENRKTITAFSWSVHAEKFEQHSELVLEHAALRFKASPFDDGIGFFYHSEYIVHFSIFQWAASNKLKELGRTLFVANNVTHSTKWQIQSFEIGMKSFGFLVGKDPIINSDCNLMAFQLGMSGIELFQKIKSHSVVSMKSIHFGQEEYLALLSKDSGVHIYQYLGLSGFQTLEGSPVRVLYGQEMITFNLELWNYKFPRPFIAVSTGRTIEILHSNVNGDTIEYPGPNSLCNI